MADKRMRPPATPTTNSTTISPPACTIPTAGAATTKLLTVLLLLHLHLLPLVLLHLLLFALEFGKCRSLAMAEEEERREMVQEKGANGNSRFCVAAATAMLCHTTPCVLFTETRSQAARLPPLHSQRPFVNGRDEGNVLVG